MWKKSFSEMASFELTVKQLKVVKGDSSV